jgi:hypothetical protein
VKKGKLCRERVDRKNRPVVILACQVFEHWLEYLLPEGFDSSITFFDYGLHVVPKKLRKTLQQAIDDIEQPSLIVLEIIEKIKGKQGIHGLHIMPVGWEEIVPRIVTEANLLKKG